MKITRYLLRVDIIRYLFKKAFKQLSIHCLLGIGHHNDADMDKLPDPVLCGEFKRGHLSQGEPSVITFDVEKTGLSMYKKTYENKLDSRQL